ncbi:MAG: hypothetical protein NVSMB25_23190 [Thermoleophilaceae bacterium]
MSSMNVLGRRSTGPLALVAALVGSTGWVSAATAMPIPPVANTAPDAVGGTATQNPVSAPQPPQHPFMAADQRSNIHVDAYQSDTNIWAGPLGNRTGTLSTYFNADCASVAFDARGRIVTVCVGLQGPTLYLLDPTTLATLATFSLPPRQPVGIENPFTDFANGGYFYLDNQDRAVIPTTTGHIFVVGEMAGGGAGFQLARDYDLSASLALGDKILSTMPDWSGRIWFVSKRGVVGDVDPGSGAVQAIDTHEPIGNSFAVDENGGVYIVSDGAMYRFDAGPDGRPQISWRESYANIGVVKPGQTERGSGTTPTVMAGGYVSITDNADPMNIVVYRTARQVSGSRVVCTQPIFAKGASSTDQSLIGAGRSMIAENNYGYSGTAATEGGGSTTPGIERVDINPDGGGCSKVWHSDEIAPSVVPKLSLANGLVYTYTKPSGEHSDPWYLTAIDFRTGATVFKRRAGNGIGFNNNYAPVTIGSDGTAYVGVLGGLVALRDATPPPQPRPAPRPRGGPAPHRRGRVRLRIKYESCRTRIAIIGADADRIASVRLVVSGRVVALERRAPFVRRVRLGGRTLTAHMRLKGGRAVVLRARLRRCGRARLRPHFSG